MPTFSRLLKSSVCLLLAARAVSAAAVTYTQASCATFDGTNIYANPTGRCSCGPDTDVPAGYVKCPAPGGDPKYGLAACSETKDGSADIYSSKCIMTCTSDAELSADGKSCQKINVAPGMENKEYNSTLCASPGYGLLIAKTKGCGCERPENPKPNGTPCKDPPTNAVSTCTTAGNVGAGICGFKCNEGFTKADDGKSCVAAKPIEQRPSGGGTDPKPSTENTCPPFMEFAFAMSDGTCACSDDNADSAFAPTGTLCSPPPAHGTAACAIADGKASCTVKCEKGFKPDAQKKTCIPDGVDQTFTNSKCGVNPPGNFYLTAVPGKGCECRASATTTPGETWCKAPSTKGAKASCFQSADLSVVECRATNCPKDTVAQGNDCVATVVNKSTRDCPTGKRYLLASETEGCICSDIVEDGSVVCFAPKSGKGVGRCTSKPDNSDAVCLDKLCDSPATLVKGDCV